MRKYILSASFFCMLNISCCETSWSTHYVEGVHLYQNSDYEKSITKFTEAIQLLKNEKKDAHIFIKINRAKNFLQLGKFYKALEDINEVIDCPYLSRKDLIDALEIRMRVYTALEMHDKFQEDYTWYKSLNPYMPIFEYTEKYIIIRHCEMMKDNDAAFTYGLFIAAGLCLDESKITRFDDTIIIERKNSILCKCPCNLSEEEKKNIQQMESCHSHCNLAARTASQLAGFIIIVNPQLFGILATIEILNNECKKCCGNNGGFYMNCIQPIADYMQLMKNRLRGILNIEKGEN